MRPNTWHAAALLLVLFLAVESLAQQKYPTSQRYRDGKAIYDYACARCHDTGEGGAPIIGDQGSWSLRSSLWEAVLIKHADEGYLGMPASGGDSRLSDYDVEVAAEYILERTFPERKPD
ncbi:MAG: c-type cytochrome [Halieaceae bacterium]|jgi:cytochrome c5|nr:c-type cytochrome [Halieaceae bacterium]